MVKKILVLAILVGVVACSSTIEQYTKYNMVEYVPLMTSEEKTLKMFTSYFNEEPLCMDTRTKYGPVGRILTLKECMYDINETDFLTLYFISDKLIMTRHMNEGKVFEHKLNKIVKNLHVSLR